MAIIKTGSLVSAIRGSVGGVTFSGNRHGAYCKRWAAPIQPRTERQNNHRGKVGATAKAWQGLDLETRQAWDTFAEFPPESDTNAFGEPKFLSGFQWFTRIQIRLLGAGLPMVMTPPTSTVPIAPGTLIGTVVWQLGHITAAAVRQYDIDEPEGVYGVVEACVVPGRGQIAQPMAYKVVAIKRSVGYIFVVTTEFRSAFGDVPYGMAAFWRLRFQSPEGLRGSASVVKSIIEEHPG